MRSLSVCPRSLELSIAVFPTRDSTYFIGTAFHFGLYCFSLGFHEIVRFLQAKEGVLDHHVHADGPFFVCNVSMLKKKLQQVDKCSLGRQGGNVGFFDSPLSMATAASIVA
jgi:hypothetical protein